ncbi:MAG: hypothetical protein HFF08_02005 [Oscillospiraceae bacterium]|nr:hypothetical protein [Oscillospiraceae bacterium]
MRLVISNGKADKRLLAFTCAAAALVLLGRALIWPAFAWGRELERAIARVSADCTERRTRMDERAGAEGTMEWQRLALAVASQPYYKPMAAWEMDMLITGLAVRHGLVPERLSLTEAAPGLAAPYRYQPEREDLPDSGLETGAAEGEEGYVLMAKAQLEAGGSTAQWQAFLDDVAWNYPGLRVTGFAVPVYGGETEAVESGGRFHCGLEIYMCGEADGR